MLKTYMIQKREKIDEVIGEHLAKLKYPEVIAEGMRYSVLNGGKRLRPMLLLMTLEALGVDESLGYSTATAIEMIHSYSLVHDDLPALDNDDYRRGKPTTHKKYGEAEAILIGDALLTHSFNVVSAGNMHLSGDKIARLVALTSEYAGVNGMIGGQMVDIQSEGKEIELPTLQYIHTHKTGMMIKLPVEAACIIGEAETETTAKLTEYSELIGLAFQIKDDILDVEGEFEKLGKPVGSDEELQKSTYPQIFGMERAKEILDEKIERAKTVALEALGEERAEIFVELADYIGKRDN